jgi:hypothetical protein
LRAGAIRLFVAVASLAVFAIVFWGASLPSAGAAGHVVSKPQSGRRSPRTSRPYRSGPPSQDFDAGRPGQHLADGVHPVAGFLGRVDPAVAEHSLRERRGDLTGIGAAPKPAAWFVNTENCRTMHRRLRKGRRRRCSPARQRAGEPCGASGKTAYTAACPAVRALSCAGERNDIEVSTTCFCDIGSVGAGAFGRGVRAEPLGRPCRDSGAGRCHGPAGRPGRSESAAALSDLFQ